MGVFLNKKRILQWHVVFAKLTSQNYPMKGRSLEKDKPFHSNKIYLCKVVLIINGQMLN